MSTLGHLALLGGTPVIQSPFIGYSTIDQTDALVVQRVIDSGSLSQFIGDAGDYFLGGPEIRSQLILGLRVCG